MNKTITKRLDAILVNTGDMALKRRAKKIISGLDPQKNEKILDVGCGDGYYLYLLDNLGLQLRLTGTDFDPNGLKNARKNLRKTIPLVQADLMKKLPFKDNTFDKIVMSEVAEHLPNDVKGLKEVYRVLKPGGLLCLTVPDANYPLFWDPVNWIMERTTGKHVKSGFWAGIWNQHIRLYKRKDIVAVAEKAKFNVVESTAVTCWSLPFNHYVINLVARALYGGKLGSETVAAVSKYKKNPKRPWYLNAAFGSVNFLDKLNDLYPSKEVGVSIFIRATKNSPSSKNANINEESTEKSNSNWKQYILPVISLLFVDYLSYRLAFNFFFVRDDWAMLWSSTFNPADFFQSTVGEHGILRTGPFHYLIFRLYAFFPFSLFWQIVGFTQHFVDALLLYLLLKEFISRRFAFMGSLLFASFAGGIEAYIWHQATGFAVTFCILTFYFYSKFLKTNKKLFLFSALFAMFLAFCSYIGRAMGLIFFLFTFNCLYLIMQRAGWCTKLFKTLVGINIFLLVLLFILQHIAPSQDAARTTTIIVDGLKSPSIFFESLGNLIKVPYLRTDELGGLAQPNNTSLIVGIATFIGGAIIGVYGLIKKDQWSFNIMIAVLWIYMIYVFNWFFGGGNTSTLVGSLHRYLSVSAVGVILLTVFVLQKFPRSLQVLVCIVIIFLNIGYSNYILANEGTIRNRSLVEPIYQTVMEKTSRDNHVQLIVVDTPNKLKSFVVQGWLPYTYAYYKGLTKLSQFPTVFSDMKSATQWVCSSKDKKTDIEKLVGVVDYRNDSTIDANHIYAWHLDENGTLEDQTDYLRNIYNNCKGQKKSL